MLIKGFYIPKNKCKKKKEGRENMYEGFLLSKRQMVG